ncbi:MAG: hypothetical protein B7Z44_09505 [Caulobacter sp. 12-67-6]|nr:MAG: hypothetical protein B7Z44_09505 [Caulobacter sp. 12-67-6]
MTTTLKSGFKISDRGQQVLLVLITLVWSAAAVIGAILAVFSPLVFDGRPAVRAGLKPRSKS